MYLIVIKFGLVNDILTFFTRLVRILFAQSHGLRSKFITFSHHVKFLEQKYFDRFQD